MPKVSVIVPCYNEQSTIRLLMDALRGQTFPRAAYVDTVPFGSFRRVLIEKFGCFDETLLTNEDYEFNARVRGAGGRIWLDPSIRSIHFALPTLLELIRQYWRYGYWKWRMLHRYSHTLRCRQALPPLSVLSLSGLAVLSIFFACARSLLTGELILYFSIMILAGLYSAVSRQKPCLVPAMHTSWGSGFLWSIFESGFKKNG